MTPRIAPIALAVALAVFAAAPVMTHATSHGSATAAGDTQRSSAEGEVRKVDKETKKITIRHGAITNLDMPPMTMVFQVTDPALLDNVKAGDKIRFSADKVGGAYVVTRMEAAK